MKAIVVLCFIVAVVSAQQELSVQTFNLTSGYSTGSILITLTLDAGWKSLGAGATTHFVEAQVDGTFITGIQYGQTADGRDVWNAAAQITVEPNNTTLTAYAIAVYDPNNLLDVFVASIESDNASRPNSTAVLPAGYVLTGGGVWDVPTIIGNFVTATYPINGTTWSVSGKDQPVFTPPSPSKIISYAIGVKPASPYVSIVNYGITEATSDLVQHPTITVSPASGTGSIITGGGARSNYVGAGSLLTESIPIVEDGAVTGWSAKSKDDDYADASTLTAFVISLDFQTNFPTTTTSS